MKGFSLEPKVLTFPNSLLVAKNAPVDVSSDEAKARIQEMFRLLYRHEGIGLAAPQIGWNVRLFILNLTGKEDPAHERVFVNPEVYAWGPSVTESEGCLSFPGMSAEIERPSCCRISAKSNFGRYFEQDCVGLEARAVLHEMDHLEGILFYERMNKSDRERNNPLLHAMIARSLRKG
jgi:peptide deformylase